jgi:cyclophilin family peptidyl-prolyl cis-trans isomerase/HEAT repeat protein
MKCPLFSIALLLLSIANAFAQIPTAINIQILKAEDSRRYDKKLEDLIDQPDERIRVRAILAAGRIGDEKAIPRLASLLESGSVTVREMAAFALGEIESVNAADAILKVLKDPKTVPAVRARAVESAGKIAAANAKDANAKELGEAILDMLEAEDAKGNKQDRDVVRLALTAALRARPEDADLVVMKFLTNLDARIRADAANTLARLRTKSANTALRAILMSDDDPVARANAVRALGAAEDKESLNMLIDAAVEDDDSRVRVSAIRALAALKDPYAVEKLLEHGEKLLVAFKKVKRFSFAPAEKSELLEIATALGRLVPNTNDSRTLRFLDDLRKADNFHSPETQIAFARVSPTEFFASSAMNQTIGSNKTVKSYADWRFASSLRQGEGELANLVIADSNFKIRGDAEQSLALFLANPMSLYPGAERDSINNAIPDVLQAYVRFKPKDLNAILLKYLRHGDVFVRATAAELLADLPVSKANADALKSAFSLALVKDKDYNDAQLGILDALYKLDKKEAVGSLLTALNAPDYLVRKKAFELLADKDLQKDFPGIAASLAHARMNRKDQVLPYAPAFGTMLGQVLNTDADYRRAVSRKNGRVKAVFTTGKGAFTIDLLPEDAPLTVDNFVKLAKARYFNGIEVHRVVPNFVMQDGDPRGDGNGGPGWSIRCEVNMVPYERGAVGMALSGKDTGGSQWFVTHSPQPHLDGGYTVFGRVNEKEMKVVDNIVRGDKIISVKIIEGLSTQRSPSTRRKK